MNRRSKDFLLIPTKYISYNVESSKDKSLNEIFIKMSKHKTLQRLILIAAISLLVLSIARQLLVTINAWRQERINKWSVKIPLDMMNTYTHKKSFTPAMPYYECYARFSMRGPVLDEFADYRSVSGGNVPNELVRNIFSQMPFKVSWRLLNGEKEICSGVFLSSEISAFVYPDYVLYTFSSYTIKGLGNLEPFREYSFIGNVEQPCDEALNRLSPTLEFRRGVSYKARAAAIRNLYTSVPVFLLGLILLCIGVVKNRSQKKKVMSYEI